MTLVAATGTFDLLHPGHVLYLERSKALGDELVVIVARDLNVRHKPKPIVPEDQRLRMVQALKVVDRAVLGARERYLPYHREAAPGHYHPGLRSALRQGIPGGRSYFGGACNPRW